MLWSVCIEALRVPPHKYRHRHTRAIDCPCNDKRLRCSHIYPFTHTSIHIYRLQFYVHFVLCDCSFIIHGRYPLSKKVTPANHHFYHSVFAFSLFVVVDCMCWTRICFVYIPIARYIYSMALHVRISHCHAGINIPIAFLAFASLFTAFAVPRSSVVVLVWYNACVLGLCYHCIVCHRCLHRDQKE